MKARGDDETLIETALLAARAAGKILMDRFGRPQWCAAKPDSSIVTEADVVSERQIKQLIGLRHPDHTFVGEETGREDRSSPFTWVVDPLDGTKNFVRGVPLFSTEIALLKDGAPYLGASYLPAMDDLLWAVRGKGAHSDEGNVRVSSTSRLDAAYVSFGNIKHFDRTRCLSNLLRLVGATSQCRGIGDAWSLHLLARGSVDIFADASTAFWDIAALAVIVEEAGGTMTDLNGHAIWERSRSVLASNRVLHEAALAQLREQTENL